MSWLETIVKRDKVELRTLCYFSEKANTRVGQTQAFIHLVKVTISKGHLIQVREPEFQRVIVQLFILPELTEEPKV